MAKGEKTTVSFDVAKGKAGTYQVRIGHQMGSFEVLPEVPVAAAFEVSELSITPAEVEIGKEIEISATVTNVGKADGSYEVVLKIDGTQVETKRVTLGAGKSTKVTFSVTRDVAATYQVEVDGQRGSFSATEKPLLPPPPPFPWLWVIVGVVAVVIIGLLIYFLAIRRR